MFNVANFFTASNLISGIMAILFVFSGHLNLAPYAIFAGLFFDFLDGFMARLFRTQGELGKQLDSLADMVTFGVAPGILMMEVLAFVLIESDLNYVVGESYLIEWFNEYLSLSSFGSWFPFAGLLIPFFSLFRLANFNIDTRQSESFIGLPTPSNTLFFITFPALLFWSSFDSASGVLIFFFNPYFIVVLMFVFGLLMVSELPLFSLKIKSFGWKGNEIRILFLIISVIFIALFGALSIALIVFLYLILSIIQNKLYNSTIKTRQDEI